MDFYGMIDVLAVRLGAMFSPKYFREDAVSGPIEEHLASVQVNDELDVDTMDDEQGVILDSPVGQLSAAVRRERWVGSESPAIVYHHGASEIPYDYGFKRLFSQRDPRCQKVNLFALRAPWHTSRADFSHGSASLARWMAMLAASVTVAEKVVQALRSEGVRNIALCGTSLGGFIVNLHHIHHDSADLYLPLMAGLAMDEAYLDSVYSCAVAQLSDEDAQRIREILNFEKGFASRSHDRVFPLLALQDRLLTYERQKKSYGDCPVADLNKGHATGALAFGEVRDHVFDRLNG